MTKPSAKLTDEARTLVVTSLACFDAPSAVATLIKREFGLEISAQGVEAYDPTKRAGRNLSSKWRSLFHETRTAFLECTANVGVSHKAVRLRALDRMAQRAEAQGNIALAAQLLEQAAKEAGCLYTNRREISGPDGQPMEHRVQGVPSVDELATLTKEERDQMRAILLKARDRRQSQVS